MLFEAIAQTSADVASVPGKKKKVDRLAALLLQAPADERAIAARYLAGEPGHKTGAGYATVAEVRPPAATAATLSVTEVDRRLAELATLEGAGSAKARKEGLGALLAEMTAQEQDFAQALILGPLRQGPLDSLSINAVAKAKGLNPKAGGTANMLAVKRGAGAEEL